MKRIALVFIAAVFVPSLVLGFLALRTAGEQRVLIERQAVELYQNDTDALAAGVNQAVLARQREFASRVRMLLATQSAGALANSFAEEIGTPWSDDGTPFAVAADGRLVAPQPVEREGDSRQFLEQNAAFLSNRIPAEVYPAPLADGAPAAAGRSKSAPAPAKQAESAKLYAKSKDAAMRQVIPQKKAAEQLPAAEESKIAPEISDFRTAISQGTDGILARFVQNELQLLLWTRPPEADGVVFGVALPASAISQIVRGYFSSAAPSAAEVCLAILDENAVPVARSESAFETTWKRPFVATEIGETLPHWEAALYLLDPARLADSARLVTLTIVFLICLALAAILAGGWFVAMDARRQLALAQKKTDFVSNVSHELKTPLTSIRMFAELLQDDRPIEPEKRARYLRIITLESERLTRLINNVLDFARIEKKRKTYHKEALDFHPVLERLWETQSEHLRKSGFACEWIADDPPWPVFADADALSQVIVNLLANAEKYAGAAREITLHSWKEGGELRIAVLDRGVGVPQGEERKIFEAFYRSNDCLANGVPGSGLGLTLALKIAQDHGGRIDVRPRSGGGTVFTLVIPLQTSRNP